MKEIAELKQTKADLEIAQEKAYSSITDQNEMVKEMVLKESRRMAEMHQQSQQVWTLKKIIGCWMDGFAFRGGFRRKMTLVS